MSTQTLTVVRPIAVTPSMLVSSSVPEDDYPEWSNTATYAKDDRVILSAQHKVYQSLMDDNTGNSPTAVTITPQWIEVGATNRWKVFDRSVSSQTRQADSISYRIKPGQAITSLSALNLAGATSMRVRLVDPDYGTVYDRTISLSRVPVAVGWWAWFFGERRAPTQALVMDMPSFPMADVLIDVEGTADLSMGVLIIGQARTFSMGVRMGARVGIQDYSRKERTDFGDVVLVERAFAKRASFQLLLRAAEVDSFNDFLASVRATPCLWIGSQRYESTTVYGFYKSFDIVIAYFDYSDCELELEGLT
ncbi:MAG: carbohydrate-binding protein [Alicycliphilus sp. 69-12]|nr:MAG: carbohydrate-binding protein [Alicycliphilus sp. 69-12]